MLQIVANGSKVNVAFDAHEFELTEAEKAKMVLNLEGLGKQTATFPVADLHIHMEYNRHSRDHVVKLSLILSGTRLVTITPRRFGVTAQLWRGETTTSAKSACRRFHPDSVMSRWRPGATTRWPVEAMVPLWDGEPTTSARSTCRRFRPDLTTLR